MSVGYQESIMTTGQDGEKGSEVIGAGKVKKKKKGKKKKKKNEAIKEEENEEDAKEKRW